MVQNSKDRPPFSLDPLAMSAPMTKKSSFFSKAAPAQTGKEEGVAPTQKKISTFFSPKTKPADGANMDL